MSLYGDFQQAWTKRFPGCILPQAWEDDVKQNLQKHRQRVAVLKEELEKEAFYVEYLERLLADVERHRERVAADGWELSSTVDNDGTAVPDDLNCADALPVEESTSLLEHSDDASTAPVASDDSPSPPDPDSTSDDRSDAPTTQAPPPGVTAKQFVTVIEVNGYGVKRDPATGQPLAASSSPASTGTVETATGTDSVGETGVASEEDLAEGEEGELDDDDGSRSSSLPGSQDSAGSSPAVRKKVPPKPPPKRAPHWPPRAPSERSTRRGPLPPPRPTNSVPSPGSTEGEVDAFNRSLPTRPKPPPPLRGSPKSTLERQTIEPETTGSVVEVPEVGVPWAVASEVVDQAYLTMSSDRSSEYDAHTLRSLASSHSGGASLSDSTGIDDGLEENSGSPKFSDYVNIQFFLKRRHQKGEQRSLTVDSDDDDDDDDDDDREEDCGDELDVGSQRERPVDELLQALGGDDSTRERATRPSGPASSVLDDYSGLYRNINSGNATVAPPLTSAPPLPSGGKTRLANLIRDIQEPVSSDVALVADAVVVADTAVADSEEAERITMIRCIINSILESETIYWECLNVLIQYTKALRSTIGTSQPVISQEDLNIIFHKIPELHAIHHAFLEGVRTRVRAQTWDEKLIVGDHFKILASRLGVYASFLQNYPRAIETVRKCSAENAKFSDITKSIKLQALKGQAASLEDLLHKPVARVQKNALVLHDLLKYTPASHPDHKALQVALRMTQCFLNEFNMSATESMFPAHDRTQRHLVKNSFIVELSEGHRKLRHLFLFNDVVVCAKYKATGRDKFAYEVKWYIPLHDAVIPLDEVDEKDVREVSTVNILSLKSQVTIVRDQIMREEQVGKERAGRASVRLIDKHRKKLAELQAQLMLASPNLVFRVGQKGGKTFIFFLSSKFERAQWIEAVTAVQSSAPPTVANLTLYEIQAWITACHKFLQTNMGSFLLRSGKEDDMLVGDLHVVAHGVQGFTKAADVFLVFEIDCYGHFFGKAKTRVIEDSVEPRWEQEFIIELEGSQMLRILCYQQIPDEPPLLRGKATIELNKSWLTNRMQEKKISLQELTLSLSLKFTHSEMSLRRVPSSKPCGVFGLKLAQVMKKEKRTIPFLITCCVREVEKRGMHELGIYRVSGSASDMQKLKRAFESNPYEAEQLLKEVDIHSVTCILKLYLRELPEGLFTDELYPKFIEAFKMCDGEPKTTTLSQLYGALPPANLDIIEYLVEHMVKVIKEEAQNKMSLQNIATVFGPTLLRPSAKLDSVLTGDKLAAGTIDVMAQATILFFYLKRRVAGELLRPTPSAVSTREQNF